LALASGHFGLGLGLVTSGLVFGLGLGTLWLRPRPRNLIAFSYGTRRPWLSDYDSERISILLLHSHLWLLTYYAQMYLLNL